jgi:outer membrane protein OmpA-like peptidoglycan-associated protein
LQPLLDSQGQLSDDVGRLLSFGGRIGKPEDLMPLERVAEDYGHTALGSALRLTLLSQRLRRPIDPVTGERPAPDFSDAQDLVQDTCTDSGVAALTYELLQQQLEPLPSTLRNRAETAAAAWDGTNAAGTTVATYSDASLAPWGPSLHFCFGQAELQRPVSSSIVNLARQLKRQRAARVVLVGHGDHVGTCRFNDALALRRAQSVKNALVAAGLERRNIAVVTLGERRPLDFSTRAEAHALNRRVEILLEPGLEPPLSVPASPPVMPTCAARPL